MKDQPHQRPPRPRHVRKPRPAATTDWNRVASWYDQLVGEAGSEYQREVIFPGVIRLLAPKTGERILDVACGQGVLSRILHELGTQVVGIDAAGELIRQARKRSNPAITYHVGDARDLTRFEPASFDAVACVLAIQNIDAVAPMLQGVANALKPGARLVIAMIHPAFRGPKYAHWGWDEKSGVQFRRIDRYLLPRKEPIYTHPGSDPGKYTWSFHRPIGWYINALGRAGLPVDAMEEWPSHKISDSGPRAKAENIARKEIPMFLALRAVKR